MIKESLRTSLEINRLWEEWRAAAERAYRAGKAPELRGYVRGESKLDRAAVLQAKEESSERRHRKQQPGNRALPIHAAARLLICKNIARGVELREAPAASIFLMMRETAAEAIAIGWLLREYLPPSWIERLPSLAAIERELEPLPEPKARPPQSAIEHLATLDGGFSAEGRYQGGRE